MKRILKMVAVVAVLGIVAAACGGGNGGGGSNTGATGGTGATGADLSGGTLRMAQIGDVSAAFDPQKEYYSVTWEYFRCCLTRTLMSYKGVPTADGGTELFPDLAAAEPTVSDDQLTWTYQIKPGVHYGDPFTDVEVTAQDFIRALERTANPKANVGGYSFYYSVIKGFDDFASGKADTISGLSAPDASTLQIEVTAPTADLSYRLAMPTAAPIPPNGDAPLGAAEGHDKNYGRFLVATGPYEFEGSDQLDFSAAPADQKEVSGYVPGRSIVLVRNPGWDAATDDLRLAYPDRIEVSIGGNNDDLYNKIKSNDLDFVVDGAVPPETIRDYQTNPDLQSKINVYPSDALRYISFNFLVPPFDDIHVRKAFNWALDKSGMRQLRGGATTGEFAGHIMVNSLENDLLKTYDPYATPNGAGDIEKAKEEMALSKYDTNKDGVCDAPECKDILAVTDNADPYPKQAALIEPIVEQLGMSFDIKELERTTMYNKCVDLATKFGICLAPAWGKDYPAGFTFASPLFGNESLYPSCCNYNGLGASAKQISDWGYTTVTSVPSVDDKIDACGEATGDALFQCWADFDTYLMEEVVPFAPYLFDNSVDITSDNVINYSFDQFAGLAAFDQMAVANKG
ncbi:MAG: ABC transporter substrate-binding protein [Actinomycetota bacterium]